MERVLFLRQLDRGVLHARKRQIETMLHGLADSSARWTNETTSGLFPLTPRAISALNPPTQEYLDTNTIDPRAPRIAASAKWNRLFKALLLDADAKFEWREFKAFLLPTPDRRKRRERRKTIRRGPATCS